MIKKIVMAVFLVLILHSQAFAGIKVVPAIIRVTLPPGGTYNTEIWIQNSSRERVEYVKVYLESNEKNPEGKWKYDKGTGGIMSMIPWTSVTPGTLSIQPGGKARIALRLNIPKRAYGDYRVALMLEQDRSKSPLPDKEMDIEDILLKKHRKERVPEETRLRLTQGVRIAVPVHVRAMAKSASAKRVVPQIKLKNLNMGIAGDGKGAFQTTLMVENTGSFDIEATGACKLLHGTKKSMLKITDLSGEKIVIMPKSKRLLKFIFSDSLPVGDYIASVNLKIKNRGFEKIVRKGIKASFKIDNTMAESLAKLAAAGNAGGDTPSVPLIVDPGRINLISRGARIKPLKLTVTNPTNKTLNIRSIFRSASQSKKTKPSVKIIPDRFSIEPGKSERIRVEIKPAGKGPVYGRLLFAVKGMGGIRPAEVPIMIVPKGVKLNPSGSISDIEVLSIKNGKSVRISGKLKNTGNAHLDDISAEIFIKDFMDKPVKKNRASVSRKILFPAEKTRLFSDFSLSDLKDDIYKAVFVVKSKGAKTINKSFRFKVDSKSEEVVTLLE